MDSGKGYNNYKFIINLFVDKDYELIGSEIFEIMQFYIDPYPELNEKITVYTDCEGNIKQYNGAVRVLQQNTICKLF